MVAEISVLRDIEYAGLPTDEDFCRWAELALADEDRELGITIRIVDSDEITRLNQTYRDKKRPTNVLSFPSDIDALPEEIIEQIGFMHLGDLALCAPVIADEALQQKKEPVHHWAHLSIHGVLHLLGYDHMENEEAVAMENRERELLAKLGINDPYV